MRGHRNQEKIKRRTSCRLDKRMQRKGRQREQRRRRRRRNREVGMEAWRVKSGKPVGKSRNLRSRNLSGQVFTMPMASVPSRRVEQGPSRRREHWEKRGFGLTRIVGRYEPS